MNIIFIPGHLGCKANFKYLLKEFPGSKAIDIIGFGSARKPEVIYDKKLFMKYLEDKISSKCVLVGHSMGCMIAKDFSLAYPSLVDKLVLINYPLRRDAQALEKTVRQNKYLSLYLDGHILAKMACHMKYFYLPLVMFFGLFKYPKYLGSLFGYFRHTYNSARSSLWDYVIKDDYKTLKMVKKKLLFITGEFDQHFDKKLAKGFKTVYVKNMGHQFNGREKEIVEIIKKEIKR